VGVSDINKSAWKTYLKDRDLTKIGLPEELKKIDFHRPGYKYGLVYEKQTYYEVDCEEYLDKNYLNKFYPDFVYDEDDEEYETQNE
jgi:hypothetical protein